MSLPSWLEPLPDAEQMRATDKWAIEELGIPSLDLMERAGAGLARLVGDVAPEGAVAIVCGKGNNGGDGLVAARLLRGEGREVHCLLLTDPGELRGDAAANLERLQGGTEPFAAARLEGAGAIVDAVLGTGFEGEVRGAPRTAIEAMTEASAPVIAADVPSGVNAATGEVEGPAVLARATATFAAAKPGLWVRPGKEHAGAVRVIDIGIPPGAPGEPQAGLIHDSVLAEIPRRVGNSTKFASGHVLVAGGARGLTGAPMLAANAAMRAGAGYVTCCVPASQQPILAARLMEVMSRALPDDDGAHTAAGVAVVLEATGRGGSLVLGPGIGKSRGAFVFARELARRAEVALLLDADGLNAHAGRLEDLASRAAPTVLTPHEGELGRLLGVESNDVKARRLHHAREGARRAGAIVVLKGDDSLVARPDGFVAVSPGATPALATAGTGDVLSGVIGALLAKEMDPFTAACAGVRLHALAGRRAADRLGADGVIASDVIEALPLALT